MIERKFEDIGDGQLVLASAPGKMLRYYAALAAVHAAAAIQKEDQEAPKRDELEATLGRWSYPDAGCWQLEQMAAAPRRGRTLTSMVFLSGLKWAL